RAAAARSRRGVRSRRRCDRARPYERVARQLACRRPLRHDRAQRPRKRASRSLPQPAHRKLAVSRRVRNRVSDERGAVLVAGLLLSLALLMVIGAGVDIGHAFIVRRELVSLADDAALTGSQALDLQALHQGRLALDPEQARAAALQALAGEP